MEQATGIVPHQVGRHVDHQLVDQAGLQHRSGQGRPRLHQHLVDLTPGQAPHQAMEIQPPAPLGQLQRCHALRQGRPHAGCRGNQHLPARGQHARPGGKTGPAVEHHPQRLLDRLIETDIEPWIIGQHRADAGDDGGTAGPQPLDIGARRRRGDPLALARGHRRATVETHGQLAADMGQLAAHAADKTGVERLGLPAQQPHRHLDARRPQPRHAAAGDLGVGIFHRRHHPGHSGGHQGVGTGRGTAMVAARLQGDVGRSAPGLFSRLGKGVDLGMGTTRLLVPTLADDAPLAYDDTTHTGIGIGGVEPPPRQPQGLGHEIVILSGKSHRTPLTAMAAINPWPRPLLRARVGSAVF